MVRVDSSCEVCDRLLISLDESNDPRSLANQTRNSLRSIQLPVSHIIISYAAKVRSPWALLRCSILHGSFHLERGSKEAERLDAVLQKCLAKDRESRFSSAADLQRELVPAIREYRLPDSQQWSSSEADTLLY